MYIAPVGWKKLKELLQFRTGRGLVFSSSYQQTATATRIVLCC